MYLKSLEIHGFKSFAQKTTLEFSQGVIAIVGPNGSGKSNVADSLRWVLGEQSPKLIRGKKSEDVIFAGSDKKARLGFAEVIATFDNADRRIPIDSAEVSLGRRIDRSGESEYLINGNRVRLLDIVDLVLKSNIGTSRYTVIGQGTIDQMILAGPGEIKGLIDEASGVKTYYIKRERTLRRLEQTAQNLMRAEDLIREIEPRLKSLRRQAKKMEARSEIETELKLYQREYFGKTYWSLKKSIDHFQNQLELLRTKHQVLEKELHVLRQQLEGYEAGIQQGNGQFQVVQQDLQKLQSHKNRVLEDLSLVRGKMQSQKTGNAFDAQTLQVNVRDSERKIAELSEKIQAARQEREKHEADFIRQTKILDELGKQVDQFYHLVNNPLDVDWGMVDRQVRNLEGTLEEFFAAIESGLGADEIKRQAATVKQSFGQFKISIKTSLLDPKAGLQESRQKLEQVLKQKEALNQEINNLQLSISKTRFSEDFLAKQLVSVEQEKLHLDLELKKATSQSADEFWQSLTGEEKRIQEEVERIGKEIQVLEHQLKAYYDQDEAAKKSLREAENKFRALQDQLSDLKDQESAINIEKAKFDTQMEVLTEEIKRILSEEIFSNIKQAEIESRTEGLEEKISKLRNQLDMIGGMDELTLKEYQETETRYTNLSTQVTDLKQGMEDLRNIIEELDEHIKTRFNESFHKVNEKFEHYFRLLFNGGRAYLSLLKEEPAVESGEAGEDPSEGEMLGELRPEEKILKKYEKGASNIIGVDIKATPPGKKLASIQALSGGERSLTAIGLLCSLLTCFPSPFVVLDEVDAALDDANTIRFGQILGTLSHQTQFLTITHNRETMAQANILYGVTMGDDGMSKLLSVKLDQAKQYAK
jgi:chromosome segregation protein